MNQRKELTEFLANLSKGDFANAQTSLSLAIEGKIKERMAAIMKDDNKKKLNESSDVSNYQGMKKSDLIIQNGNIEYKDTLNKNILVLTFKNGNLINIIEKNSNKFTVYNVNDIKKYYNERDFPLSRAISAGISHPHDGTGHEDEMMMGNY